MAKSLIQGEADFNSPAESSRTISERFVRGDSGAFDELVALYQQDVTRLAYRIVGWREGLVEDIVQEVFLAAFCHRSGFRNQCSLKTWLRTITVNKSRSVRRKRILKLRMLSNITAGAKTDSDTVGRNLLGRERSAQVRGAVLQLPRRLREVTVLRYLEEMGLEEIAEVLGIGHNAVEVRLSRARRELKSKLARIVEE